MNSALNIAACAPDDPLFAGALRHADPAAFAATRGGVADSLVPKKCLVAMRGGEPVGRVAVYRNEAMQIDGKPVAQLGDYACVQDEEVAKALMGAALALARKGDAAFAVGPMNGSTWETYRFITWPGAEPAFFTEMAHPPYYPAQWQAAGFAPYQAYVSSLAPVLVEPADEVFISNELTVRGIRTDYFREDLELVYPLCSAAFAGNPLFTPIGLEDFVSKLLPLQSLALPAFTKIVTDHAGEPVAFILAMPDVLDPAKQTLILKTAARHPDCAVRGLMPALYSVVCEEASALGYSRIIHAFMHEDNASLRRSRQLAGEVIRRYTLFIQPC